AKAPGARDEDLADRDRRHHDVGRPPARLFAELPGQRLLALLFVRVTRGAAVEKEPFVHEAVPETDEIVVDALVEDEITGRGRHVQQLRRRGALVREDEGAQAGPRRVGSDRRAGVTGTDDRGGRETELERGPDGGGRRAVLDGARGIGA